MTETSQHRTKPLVFLGNGRSAGNMISTTLSYRLTYERNDDRKFFHLEGVEKNSYEDMVEQHKADPHWIICGHNVFGVHDLLGEDVDYFMNLRQSRSRLVSKARQWRDETDGEAFLRSDWDFSNGVTKRLAGLRAKDGRVFNLSTGEDYGPQSEFELDETFFELAKKNMERVPNVIIKERMAESIVMTEMALGLPPIFCFRFFNFNRSRPNWNASTAFLDVIDLANQYDAFFYAHYQKALDAQLENISEHTRTVIAAREKAMDAIVAMSNDTEVSVTVQQTLAAANECFAKGEIDCGYEILYLITVSPHVNTDIRRDLVGQIGPLPDSASKERVVRSLETPPTLRGHFESGAEHAKA